MGLTAVLLILILAAVLWVGNYLSGQLAGITRLLIGLGHQQQDQAAGGAAQADRLVDILRDIKSAAQADCAEAYEIRQLLERRVYPADYGEGKGGG